ncbi:MAG: hypothetical protein ACK4FJ_06055 [Ferrovibrio sp.]|uniref:hypothetical protein n=1 Tax=Ferrovibrio sp. TaxID=1917215 RepID=UPI00391A4926
MAITIFFSWQADTATKTGRNLIERALERAISAVASDIELEEAVREGIEIDRDTKGVPGSPPIVETIFRKIDQAAIFLPDLTFVGKRIDGRPAPNPNVMIEYGWALSSLGHSRIIPVMNTAYGPPSPENMPFDLRHLRNPILYDLPEDANDDKRREERIKLARKIEEAIRVILSSAEYKASLPKMVEPALFKPKNPENGHARFRAPNSPLAYIEGHPLNTKETLSKVVLSEGPAIWLRVMPKFDSDKRHKIVDIKDWATSSNNFLMPLGGTGWSQFNYMRDSDGFGIYAATKRLEDDSQTSAFVFIFETGEIWSADTYILGAMRDKIPYYEFELVQALDRFSKFLEKLGEPRPYKWIAGYEGIKGRSLAFPPRPGYISLPGGVGTCFDNAVIEEGFLESADSSLEAIKPLFEKIFDKCGVSRPEYLDENIRQRIVP